MCVGGAPAVRTLRPGRRPTRSILAGVVLFIGLLQAACSHDERVKIVRTDGTVVIGTIVAVRPDAVVISTAGSGSVTIPRALIASMAPFTPDRADATKRDTSTDSGGTHGASGNASGGKASEGGQ